MTSTLDGDSRFACSNDTFTCTVEAASRLQWVATPHISASNPITFTPSSQTGTSRIRDPFCATLTEVSQVNLLSANFTSVLSIENVANLRGNTVVIQCIGLGDPAQSNLTVEGETSNGLVRLNIK